MNGIAIVAATILASLVVSARGASPLPAQGTSKSAKDGAYTIAQADRGNAAYRKNCGSCHKDDMTGSAEAPALVGETFIAAWQDRSVGDLVDLVRTTMPYDQPNSLEPQAYVDIVACLLQRNNYRPGSAELPVDTESLKNLLLK
jgi:mono/diheme cytochrome c family protein